MTEDALLHSSRGELVELVLCRERDLEQAKRDQAQRDARIQEIEEVGEKIRYRLAQRPGSYVILKIVRKTVKRKDTNSLSCAPALPSVLEKSYADVSPLAGMLVDKFRYHLPLYRQH